MNAQINDKLISIVVPVFNTDLFFLNKCLESVQRQDYSNFEVLLIDGGSNLECINLLNEFVKKDSRFSLHSSIRGAGPQRNRGIELSRGDFILFIDSDDHISDNFLNDIYNYLILNNFDIVAPVMVKEKYENNNVVENYEMPHEIAEGYVTENNYFINSTSSGIVHPVKLYRKSIIGETRFPDVGRGQDMLFNYSLSVKGFKYGVCKSITYFYTARMGANYAKKKMDFHSIKIVKIVHSLFRKYRHTNKDNLTGLYKVYDFIFGNYFNSSANSYNIVFLFYLFPYKFKYLKHVKGKRKIYVLFPILYISIKKIFRRKNIFNR